MTYLPPQRNFDNVQFEKLRKKIDTKFNDIHDELSDCYYGKKPFQSYGILTKEQFDKLHGLIFLKRDVEFHKENLKQSAKDKIPEEKYNDINDSDGNIIGKKDEQAEEEIIKLKNEGLELII